MMSTFVHSASHVSGDTSITDTTHPIGLGIGTKAYVLNTMNLNHTSWDLFWFHGMSHPK